MNALDRIFMNASQSSRAAQVLGVAAAAALLSGCVGGRIASVNLHLRLGWSHEFADASRPVTASFAGAPAISFTTLGASAPRDGAVLGLGANALIADATSIYARYDCDLQGGNTSHIFSVGLRMVW